MKKGDKISGKTIQDIKKDKGSITLTIGQSKISYIKSFPTLFNDKERGSCHESILKSFQILELVKEMLIRNDSHETILMVIEECEKETPTK
jgi:hypothetical protein